MRRKASRVCLTAYAISNFSLRSSFTCSTRPPATVISAAVDSRLPERGLVLHFLTIAAALAADIPHSFDSARTHSISERVNGLFDRGSIAYSHMRQVNQTHISGYAWLTR